MLVFVIRAWERDLSNCGSPRQLDCSLVLVVFNRRRWKIQVDWLDLEGIAIMVWVAEVPLDHLKVIHEIAPGSTFLDVERCVGCTKLSSHPFDKAPVYGCCSTLGPYALLAAVSDFSRRIHHYRSLWLSPCVPIWD